VTKKSLDLNGLSRINLSVKNCYITLKENDASDKIDFSISSSRNRDIDFDEGSTTNVKVKSLSDTIQCECIIKLPTNVQLPDMYFTIEGDKKSRLLDEGDFRNFFNFNVLSITNENSNFLAELTRKHTIVSFVGGGEYLATSFSTVKITNFVIDVNTGYCHIVQNSDFTANTVKMSSPLGTFCASGTTITNNAADDASCSSIDRSVDYTSDTISTSSYCISDIMVCSTGS
jgi:hypothetical protein